MFMIVICVCLLSPVDHNIWSQMLNCKQGQVVG